MRGFTGEVPKAQRVLVRSLRGKGLLIEENVQCEGREADIIIPDARLIVEIDGLFHLSKLGKEDDQRKTGIWEERGYTVIRFTNREALHETKRCAEEVYSWVKAKERAVRECKKSYPLSSDRRLEALRQDLLKEERLTAKRHRGESIEAFFLRKSGEEPDGMDR